MKKIITLLTACAFLGISSAAFAGIALSKHDFSANANITGSNDQICITCHTPHNALSTEGPLWNHKATGNTSFTMYSSSTLNGTLSGSPDGTSKLCLGCHDGSTALDAWGPTDPGSYFIGTEDIAAQVGTGGDLSGSHPVSITYNATTATDDGGLHNPATTLSGITGSTGYIAGDMLFAGEVHCSSCHDVHDKNDVPMLLHKANTGSALCLTCHDK